MACATAALAFMVESRAMTGESATGEYISLLPACSGFSSLSFFFLAAKSFKDIFTFGMHGMGGGGGEGDSTLPDGSVVLGEGSAGETVKSMYDGGGVAF